MPVVFGDFDISDFWEESDYANREYVDDPLTDEIVRVVEATLGYTLPASYIELMRYQNGGIPKKACHRTNKRTTWAEDHIAITGIYSIGSKQRYSLCGPMRTEFWTSEWGYPAIGIYFADCPSAGHDMVCLDYRKCGRTGEPEVVHVDQEWDYEITFVAKNFESFIRGLQDDEVFEP